jgi:hypothetical protein
VLRDSSPYFLQLLVSLDIISVPSKSALTMPQSEDAVKGGRQTLKGMIKKITPALFTACFITAMLNMLFGFDTTSFSGVQSIPAFERQFGTPTSDGGYGLSSSRASFMSSVAFSGKFFGTLVCDILLLEAR